MVLATHLLPSAARARGAWRVVLLVTLAQGLVGYVQYLTGLPETLVLVHMLGAALLTVALTSAVRELSGGTGQASAVDVEDQDVLRPA
jgi:cytochrome c oxidase assembly protein subunit 15